MAELTYAELTPGRESTRLPHTHKFTSLKNVIISAVHKIDKRIHIQSKKISNDQELIQSDPTSCPQNQKGNN